MERIDEFIVRLLRGVAAGKVDGEVAMQHLMEREREITGHRDYVRAWSTIQHFVSDADIRSREESYDRKQRDDMEKLAARIVDEGGA
jgi:hypothetical protein